MTDGLARALAGIRRVGPYGVLRTGPGPADRPLRQACGEPAGRLAAVAAALGTGEPRVAASSVQYELAERLWTVTIALWSGHGLALDLSGLTVGPDPAVWRLAAPAPRASSAAADRVASQVLDLLAALHDGLRTVTPVADGLLWGNAATAATLALRTVSGGGAQARAEAFVRALLDRPPLRHRLMFAGGAVVRRSCCLYYRTRHARTCGDCPLPARTAARAVARLRRSR